jgi:hypothetical protein
MADRDVGEKSMKAAIRRSWSIVDSKTAHHGYNSTRCEIDAPEPSGLGVDYQQVV